MREGYCYYTLANDGRCLQHSDRVPAITKPACCCTGGAAWGHKCDKCPAVGTGNLSHTAVRLTSSVSMSLCLSVCLSVCLCTLSAGGLVSCTAVFHLSLYLCVCVCVCVLADLWFKERVIRRNSSSKGQKPSIGVQP